MVVDEFLGLSPATQVLIGAFVVVIVLAEVELQYDLSVDWLQTLVVFLSPLLPLLGVQTLPGASPDDATVFVVFGVFFIGFQAGRLKPVLDQDESG